MAFNQPNMPLLLAGLGTLSGNNPQQGFGNAMGGLQTGFQIQERRQKQEDQQRQEAERKQNNERTMAAFERSGKFTPEQIDIARNNPAAVREMFGVMLQRPKVDKPNYKKAADGYLYDMNTGKRALPEVEKAQTDGISIGPDGRLIVNSRQDEKNRANSVLGNQQNAASSTKMLDNIKAMRKALDGTGYMGPGAGLYGGVDDFLEGVGSPVTLPGNSASRAIIKAGGMKFVLDQVQQTKGAISNKEMELFQAAAPGLSQTRAGARILLDIAEKVAIRQQQRTDAMEKYRLQNKTLDGFEQQWAQYVESNPIVTDDMFAGQQKDTSNGPSNAVEDILKRHGI